MKRNKIFTDEEFVENRLRLFVNKYYRIKIIQGIIISLGLALLITLCLVILANSVHASGTVRNTIFIVGMAMLGAGIVWFVGKPLAQRIGWIHGLNFKEASKIIQEKHKSVEDRIINIIELTREKVGKDNRLYDYAIAQKTSNISDIKFDDAVPMRKLGIFSFRLLALSLICTGIVLLWPDFIRKGIGQMWPSGDLVTEINRVEFIISSDPLEVESGKDFLLKFSILAGLPVESASIRLGSNEERANKVSDGYEHLFNAVNSAVNFRISANGVLSDEYVLKVLKKPEVAGIRMKMIPPAYTGMESVLIEGDGNAEVPEGSRIIWTVKTVNTDELSMISEPDTMVVLGKENNWNYEKIVSKSYPYEFLCKSNNGLQVSYFYKISVVKDLYPQIEIAESRDSSISEDVYIQGVIQDDYGFSKLEVITGVAGRETIREIEIKKETIFQDFYYTIIPDSSTSVYYFRIWDNDRVGGPKYTESRKISIRIISKSEREDINKQLADSIKNNIAEGMDAIDKMEKKISQFKMEQILGELKPWEIQERIKELNELKMDVIDFLNNISKTNKEFTENEEILNIDEDFTERAKEIQELMEGLMDEEMRELLKQFEELAKEFNSQKADDLTEKMEMNLEKLKEQMEMGLELMKKYNMEKDLMKQAEKLNELADSVMNDKKEEEAGENSLKEEFKKWEEEYEKTLKEDEQLKKPMGLEKMEEERDDARKDAEELDKKNDGKPAKEKKENASKSLKNLAKKMKDMLGMKGSEGQSIDLEDLRQIRNSLNDYSKKQEELNIRIADMNRVNPTLTAVLKQQKDLEEKFKGIRDSLKSMGYKQPMIAKMIGSELFHVETSIKNLFESYEGNQFSTVRIEQNRIMSEINRIAVKLDEMISNMQMSEGSGSGQQSFTDRKPKKKGDKKGSEKLGETKSMQESLKEQLQNAIQKMKSGPGGKKERGELARMLGEREMMRKALEKTLQEGGLGSEARDRANEALNMMKEVEKDIIYNKLSDQTLEKDQWIRTKLLDAENAEKERENENRRESKEFRGSFDPNRKELEPVNEKNRALEQMLKYNELKLKRFYQEKYLKYIESTKK